jgi:signal transduction histidine kinase
MREEMSRTKDQIYAGVLHDINAPLNVITGFVQLINESMQKSPREGEGQLESYRSEFARMHGVAERCIEISQRYLSFLRNQPGETKYVGVGQILADMRDLLHRHPSMKGNELIVHDVVPAITAEIDGTDLLQILLNLTINALQASDRPHRVEIHARLLNRPVAVEKIADSAEELLVNRDSFSNTPPLAAISVHDDGPGILPRDMARLFRERFTTKPPHIGTGFGLSIVQRLTSNVGGAIHVRTNVGSGSTFTVLLRVKP